MKIIANATHLRTLMSSGEDHEESACSGTLRDLPKRPLHETLQPSKRKNPSPLLLGESTAVAHARPGFNGTWRSESDMPARKVMLQEIVRSIRRRRPDAPELFKRQQLPMMAKKLEEALYKNARSLNFYADLSTLEPRLEVLARNVKQQAAAAEQRPAIV